MMHLELRERRRPIWAFLKAVLLTVHTVLSGAVGCLIVIGFLSAFIPDGSNNNGGGMLLGLTAAFVCVVQLVPLLAATAARRLSPWWVAAHSVLFVASIVLIACAAEFETGSSDR